MVWQLGIDRRRNGHLPGRADNDRLHKFDMLASTQPTRYFTLGVALSLYSGRPVNITTGGDDNHDGRDRRGSYSLLAIEIHLQPASLSHLIYGSPNYSIGQYSVRQ